MGYRRATAYRRDFFRTPTPRDTTTAARTIKAPSAPQRRRSTRTRTVEGRARTSVALLIAGVVALPAAFSTRDALSAEYTLMPSPQTVHIGHFSAALKPVLTINSGDIVTIESVGGPDPADVDASGVVPPSAVPEHVRTIRREVTDRGPGPHILTGPVFVNGAMPGDVLELRILDIDFAVPYGFNVQRPYTGALPDEFPGFFQRIIPIDSQTKSA